MKYQHYKGGCYELVCEAKLESDPAVTMIIYRSLADGIIWARPRDVFFESVLHAGQLAPRFTPIAD